MGAVVAAVVLVAATRGLWPPPGATGSAPVGHDAPVHLAYTVEFAAAFADGVWWPRWLPDLSRGYGGPNALFYAPLPFHLSGRLAWFGLGPGTALRIAAACAVVLAFAGMFVWARTRFGLWAGLGAAALYVLAPYQVWDAGTRFAYPELLGLGVAPWLFWLADRAADAPRATIALAFGLTTLLLTHNLSVVLFGGLLGVYVLCEAVRRGDRRGVLALTRAGLLSLALGAFFWVPVVVESDSILMRRHEGFSSYWRTTFLDLERLFLARVPVAHEAETLVLGWGLGVALCAALGVLLARLRRAPRDAVAGLLLLGIVGLHLLLTTRGSLGVWEALPALHIVQFPYRWLAPATLGAAWLAALAIDGLRRWPGVEAGASVAVCAAAVALVVPMLGAPVDALGVLTAADLRAEDTRGDHEGNYVPFGARAPLTTPEEPVSIARGQGVLSDVERQAHRQRFRLDAETSIDLDIHTFAFPGWTGRLNGEPLELVREETFGGMRARLPPGTHDLELRFGHTPVRLVALLLSLAALGLGVALLRAPEHVAVKVATGLVLLLTVATTVMGVRRVPVDPTVPVSGRGVQVTYQHADDVALTRVERGFDVADWRRTHEGLPVALPLRMTRGAEVFVEFPGLHRFVLEARTAAALYVDGEQVATARSEHDAPAVSTAQVELDAGRHEVAVVLEADGFVHGSEAVHLSVRWQPPGGLMGALPPASLQPAHFPWLDAAVVDPATPLPLRDH